MLDFDGNVIDVKHRVAFAASLFDQDGIQVRFMNSQIQGNNLRTEQEANNLISQVKLVIVRRVHCSRLIVTQIHWSHPARHTIAAESSRPSPARPSTTECSAEASPHHHRH